MSQSAALGAQSHFNPSQALKRYFTEEGRSIIPILRINACKWLKQHFHGNSCKFVIDLYLQPCFDMCCSLSTPLPYYRVVSFERNSVSSKGKSEKSLLPGKKWCCHRGACGYFTGNICALGSREAVQGGFICIVAVQGCFSQALSTGLCHKLRYLKTGKNQKCHQLKLTGWPLLIQQCLRIADGVREAFHSRPLCCSVNKLVAAFMLIYSTWAQLQPCLH